MSWFTEDSDWQVVLADAPVINDKFAPFYDSFRALPQIPAGTLELCRLRLAQLHQCETEFLREEVNLPAQQRDSLSNWPGSNAFSAAERACLEFAEVYAMDVSALTDAQADAVKAHYGDAGLVALVQALGVFYGTIRVSLLWAPSDAEPKQT